MNTQERLAENAMLTDWHEERLVELEQQRRMICKEASGIVSDEELTSEPRNTKEVILAELLDRGIPTGPTELSLVIGVSRQAIHRHLVDLAYAGKVRRGEDGMWQAAPAEPA